jgi:hypothetical protein
LGRVDEANPLGMALAMTADHADALRYQRVIEGRCPICNGPLRREDICGWCPECDCGWSFHRDTITRIDDITLTIRPRWNDQ